MYNWNSVHSLFHIYYLVIYIPAEFYLDYMKFDKVNAETILMI